MLQDVYVNSFFPCRARLWDFLPIECFSLTYDLNGLKSRINRHLLKQISCTLWSFCASFSCNSMPHSGCSALHIVNPNLNKRKNPTDKIVTKTKFFNTGMAKVWSNESKAFSISIVTKNTSSLRMPVISMISTINLPLSPINLF